jgi:hemin uptake protein HemP
MLNRPDHLTAREEREPRSDSRSNTRDFVTSLSTRDSAELLNGARRIAIQHRGETYFLTETRANKLILTK